MVVPPQNDVDIYTQDLGFIAIADDRELTGFNVTVGGGMGVTHGEPETYDPIGWINQFAEFDEQKIPFVPLVARPIFLYRLRQVVVQGDDRLRKGAGKGRHARARPSRRTYWVVKRQPQWPTSPMWTGWSCCVARARGVGAHLHRSFPSIGAKASTRLC